MKNKKIIRIPCDCHTEEIEIAQFDTDPDLYYMTFNISSFMSGQSVIGILLERLKMAWLALRKGNYIHQEIILTKENLEVLRDGLNDYIPIPNTAGTAGTVSVCIPD